MVSGCLDGIDIETCLEFLTGKEVEQFQWIDNSAARQLVWRFFMHWNVNKIFACAMVNQKRLQDSKFDAYSFANYQGWFLLRQKHRGEVEKQDVFACHWDGRHSETARPSEQRRQVPCGRSNLPKKNMQIFFLAKWVFRGKCWNDATKTGKSQMVNRWSKLTNSRRSAWNFHSWTWDNMGWLPHIEMSASSFLTPQPGPFWLKSFAARFAVRVHFFRAVEIGFMVYLHLVNFFRVALGPIYLGLAQVCSIWFKVCLCVVYYLKFYGVYLNFVYAQCFSCTGRNSWTNFPSDSKTKIIRPEKNTNFRNKT